MKEETRGERRCSRRTKKCKGEKKRKSGPCLIAEDLGPAEREAFVRGRPQRRKKTEKPGGRRAERGGRHSPGKKLQEGGQRGRRRQGRAGPSDG
jgi:hypothetical protein